MVELMLGMVLTLMVGAVTYRILVTNQRLTRSQSERVGMQDNVRSGTLIIGSELREVGYDRLPAVLNGTYGLVPGFAAGAVRSDIVAIGPDSLRYKAMRGFGVVCNRLAGTSQLVLRNHDDLLQSVRTLAVGDSLMVYAEDNTLSSADDVWLHAAITGAPVDQNCPDGQAGRRITIQFNPIALGAAAAFPLMTDGAPVRFFEEMVLRSYTANGDAWLGVRNLNTSLTAIQPVLGPISNGLGASQGLALEYRDANGVVTNVPANVRSVGVTLRGISDNPVHRGVQGYRRGVDTLAMTTHVALRNALR